MKRILAIVVVLGLLVAGGLWYLRPRPVLTVSAEFAHTEGVFAGNNVHILGVPVGRVESVTPHGDTVTVTMSLPADTRLPAGVQAWVVVPSVVSDHVIELGPAYTGGATLGDGGRIPVERSHAPVRWDQLLDSVNTILTAFGPDGANADGALGRALAAGARSIDGTGEKFAAAIQSISQASTLLAGHTDDVTELLTNLDQLMRLLADNQSTVDSLASSITVAAEEFGNRQTSLTTTIGQLSSVLAQLSDLITAHGPSLVGDLDQLAQLSATIVGHQQALVETLDVLPLAAQNIDRGVTDEEHLRIRLDISTNLSQFPATRALCDRLPLPLCTGAGVVNPIPFPPDIPDPLGLTALLGAR